MLSWLATAWRALVALLAFRQGRSAGIADQRQADQIAALQQTVETQRDVAQADTHAARDADTLARQLRGGGSNL